MFNKQLEIIILTVVVFLYLLFSFSLASLPGYSADIEIQQSWGNLAMLKGLAHLYEEGLTVYPPFYLNIFKLNAVLNYRLTSSFDLMTPFYIFISKIIPILSNLLIGIIIYIYLFKNYNRKSAMIGIVIYLFNLAIIYNTAYWGQFDAFYSLLMFLVVIFLIKKNYIWASIFMTLSILTKFQAIVLLPIVGVLLLLNCNFKKWLKIISANLAVLVIILLPYIPNTLREIFNVYFSSIDLYPYVTMNAYNFWFLFSREMNWQNSLTDDFQIGWLSLKFIGLFVFGIYTLLVIYQLIKDQSAEKIILAASSMAFAFFMLPTQIHERYLFPFFCIFALVALKNYKYFLVYMILSITFLINLMIVLPFPLNINIVFPPIQNFLNILIKNFSALSIAIIIAIINIIVFIFFNKIGILKNLIKNFRRDYLHLI